MLVAAAEPTMTKLLASGDGMVLSFGLKALLFLLFLFRLCSIKRGVLHHPALTEETCLLFTVGFHTKGWCFTYLPFNIICTIRNACAHPW